MKAWKSIGNWLHKKTGITHSLEFAIICEDNEDPIEAIKKGYDVSGMDYLNGQVEYLEPPVVVPIKGFN